ncbi:G-type lectin S-receptor-like serine/threonine-protein kinase At1g34300 [Punica granatum]|uniref:G-type lectin S-receptor-like serine/threonine-protein kinase At1g34300 n=1 Tax=Punica granatum TaxID=22663 RepID=A0A6P8EHJ4_PUNGR|nr:G-type lectin S-receptor-like serine/threonine-protein kinase At1g34300 [Punica granatum]
MKAWLRICDDSPKSNGHPSPLLFPLLLLVAHPITTLFNFTVSRNPSQLDASFPNQIWSSPNKTFFIGLLPAPSSSSSFVAAITYFDRSVLVLSTPSSVDRSCSLRLLPTGNLVLSHGDGSTVWSSNTSSKGVSSSFLDDSGKLILRNATGITLWAVLIREWTEV